MSHNVESMAYRFGDRADCPWHGLGVPVDRNERVSTHEFQMRAGAAWTAELHPLWVRATKDTSFKDHIVTDARALLRSDNQLVLNVVGSQYKPVQNAEVFNFFEEFCTAGDMDIETGGVLDLGRTVWCLASIREGFTLGSGDRVQGYLLFSNSHGGNAGKIKFTPIRVVCANTLAMAHNGNGSEFRIHHRSRFDASKAKDALGLGHEHLEAFKQQAEFLASRRMDDAGYTRFLDALFPVTRTEPYDTGSTILIEEKRPRNYARAVEALQSQISVNLHRDTWWDGYNAITYMVDHLNPAKEKSRALNSSWFGTGEKLKVQALNTALEMAR